MIVYLMKRFYNIAFIVIFTILLITAIFKLNMWKIFRIEANAEGSLIVLAVLLTIFRFLIWNFKWQLLISSTGTRVPFFRLLPILMAGVFVSTSTPGANIGGEPLRAYYLAREAKIKKSAAMATIIMDKAGNYFAFLIYSIIAFIILIEYFEAEVTKLLFFILLIITSILLIYVKMRKNNTFMESLLRFIYPLMKIFKFHFETFEDFDSFICSRMRVFIDTLKLMRKKPLNLVLNIVLSFVLWLTSFIKTYLVFLALGINTAFLLVAAIKTVSILAGMFSLIPGGFGVTEGVMVALFTSYGINTKLALAGVVLSRAIYYFFSIGIGYICLLWLKVHGTKN